MSAESYGVTTLGTVTSDDLLARIQNSVRTLDITVKTGEGELVRGTLMSLDAGSGHYVDWAHTGVFAGVLLEGVDATSTAVKTFMGFDVDLCQAAVFAGTTEVSLGFYPDSLINIVEGF